MSDLMHNLKFEGYYYDGNKAKRENVSIYVESSGLTILKQDGTTEFWTYDVISHTQGFHRGDPVHLENANDNLKTLVVNSPGLIESIKSLSPNFGKKFSSPISKNRLFVLTVYSIIALAIILPIIYLWLLPKLSEFAAMNVPVGWEEELGGAYAEVLAPDSTLCRNNELYSELEKILLLLTATVPRSPYKYKIKLVDDSTVNAYALPGGYMIIYRGLIEKMESPDELAGVLAHEIQHVEQKHGMKSMFHQLSFKALIAMMVGDTEGVGNFLDTASLLGVLGYSRDAEREADKKGMDMIYKSKVDPSGMVNFFKMIDKEYGDLAGSLNYLSTHPSNAERIKYLETLSNKYSYTPINLIAEAEWNKLKKTCNSND